jgi:hypothetical protein
MKCFSNIFHFSSSLQSFAFHAPSRVSKPCDKTYLSGGNVGRIEVIIHKVGHRDSRFLCVHGFFRALPFTTLMQGDEARGDCFCFSFFFDFDFFLSYFHAVLRWETISVLVPLIRVSKRLMTGRLSNWLTFSAQHIKSRRNNT